VKLREKKLLGEIASKKELDAGMVKELERVTKAFVGTFTKGAKKVTSN